MSRATPNTTDIRSESAAFFVAYADTGLDRVVDDGFDINSICALV